MKKRTKILLIIAAVVVIGGIVIGNIVGGGKEVISVHAEKVSVKDLTEKVSASGWVQPKTKVNITSEVTAEIIAIPVRDGEIVTRGQLLVLLDTVQLQKDVDQYQYSLDETVARTDAAKSLYLQAEEEFNRQKELFDRKLISETAFNNAQYSYMNSKYSYEAMINQTKQAQARYEKAIDNLNKTSIVSPMDGVITYVDAEVGEIAPAQTAFTQGKTLMTISNLSTFEVEVDVDETEIIKVKNGQKAKIEVDAFPDTLFEGEVVEIGNTAMVQGQGTTEQSTNFKVKILFVETHANIRPGMSATVDIITNVRQAVLAVPYGAIVMRPPETMDSLRDEIKRDSGKEQDSSLLAATIDDTTEATGEGKKNKKPEEIKGLFLADNGKAKFVPVETGIADQKDIEITSGVTKDVTVITGPFRILRTIKNGADIKVIEQPKFGMKDASDSDQ